MPTCMQNEPLSSSMPQAGLVSRAALLTAEVRVLNLYYILLRHERIIVSFSPLQGGHAVSRQCLLDGYNMAQRASKKTICCPAHCQWAHSEQADLKIGSACITSMLGSKWTEWTELPRYLCLPSSTTQVPISPNSDIQCAFPLAERWMFSDSIGSFQ